MVDVLTNWTRNCFDRQDSVSAVMKVKSWGKTESLLCFCFVEPEAETLLETGVSPSCSGEWFDRWAFLQSRDPPRPSSCFHSQLFWPLRVFHNSRAKKRKGHTTPAFLPSFPSSTSWVNFVHSGIFSQVSWKLEAPLPLLLPKLFSTRTACIQSRHLWSRSTYYKEQHTQITGGV